MSLMNVKCGCGNSITMTKENTVLHVYARPIYSGQCPFSHAWVQCRGHNLRYFATKGALDQLASMGVEVKNFDYPDELTMKAYGDIHGAEQLKTYRLTDRLEVAVKKFGKAMTAMPADLLFDELTGAQPKRLPGRWI